MKADEHKSLCDGWTHSSNTNFIYHECPWYPQNRWEWATRTPGGKWLCRRCGEIAPQAVEDACLLLKVKSWKNGMGRAIPIEPR